MTLTKHFYFCFQIKTVNSVLNQPFPVFNIHSNESVSLSCPSVSGNQVRKWYKDGVDFIAAGNMTNWVVTGSSSGSTGGVYCCRVDASSQANESIANCYIVNVKCECIDVFFSAKCLYAC